MKVILSKTIPEENSLEEGRMYFSAAVRLQIIAYFLFLPIEKVAFRKVEENMQAEARQAKQHVVWAKILRQEADILFLE